MSSFKLQKQSNKEQVKGAGALLLILGLIAVPLLHVGAGLVLILFGAVLLIGSMAATE